MYSLIRNDEMPMKPSFRSSGNIANIPTVTTPNPAKENYLLYWLL